MTARWPLVVCFGLALGGCLPNPQSVKERREQFPRDDLIGSLILDSVPSDAEPVKAVFGNRIELLAYRLDPPTPRPGDRVAVTFYWSATGIVDEDYQVFVHGDAIGGQAGRIHGDHFPGDEKYPTDVWQKGEVIVDRFKIFIPPGYGPKKLGLHTGLYKGNYRVPLTDKGVKPGASDNRSLAVTMTF